MTMTITDLRDRVIEDGIASVGRDDRMDEGEKRGSVRGFERCRTLLTTDDFATALHEIEDACMALRDADADIAVYWEQRYEGIQVEFVRNVLAVAWGQSPVYASAAMRYADIVGVGGRA